MTESEFQLTALRQVLDLIASPDPTPDTMEDWKVRAWLAALQLTSEDNARLERLHAYYTGPDYPVQVVRHETSKQPVLLLTFRNGDVCSIPAADIGDVVDRQNHRDIMPSDVAEWVDEPMVLESVEDIKQTLAMLAEER